MSHSTTPDPRFRAWLLERAQRQAPADLLARTMQSVEATTQQQSWLEGWPGLRFSALLAAPVVVLAITVGIVLSGLPVSRLGPDLPASPHFDRVEETARPTSTPVASVEPSPAQTPPEQTGAPTAEPRTSGFQAWTRVDMPNPRPENFGGGTPVGIVRIGERLVAIGRSTGGLGGAPAEGSPPIWVSDDDGVTWVLDEAVSGLTSRFMERIATDGTHLVATGSDDIGTPAAWTSLDGTSWTRTEGTVPDLVAGGPGGLIGVGRVGSREQAHFLVSTDGGSWTDAGAAGAEVRAIGFEPDGRAWALGIRDGPNRPDRSPTTDVLVWRSADGTTWQEPEILLRDGYVTAAIADDDGLVIVGGESEWFQDGTVLDHQRVWRLAATGLRQLPVDPAEFDYITGVFAVAGNLVVTADSSVDGPRNVTIWISPDGGTSWQRVPQQEAFAGASNAIVGVVEVDDGLVAVGRRLSPLEGHLVPVAWISSASP